jgi:hypothetical protein
MLQASEARGMECGQLAGHPAAQPLSRRAYAKRRGIDESAVRRRIRDGSISAALTVDNRIDPILADALWAQNSSRPHPASDGSDSLAAAAHRHLLARVLELRDRIIVFEASLLWCDHVFAFEDAIITAAETVLLPLATALAPQTIGRPAADIAETLRIGIYDALTTLADANIVQTSADDPSGDALPSDDELERLNTRELAIRKHDLLARLSKKRRLRNSGVLLAADKVEYRWTDGILKSRARLLVLPSKLAPWLAATVDVAEAGRMIADEIDAALDEFRALRRRRRNINGQEAAA